MFWLWPLSLTILTINAHSWVERLMRLEKNGTMVGRPGYIRGNVARSDPAFSDFSMQFLALDRNSRMCKETQSNANYATSFPALRAYPGDFIALQYQENGHVTLPQLTPHKAPFSQVYVYGTAYPRDDDMLFSIHGVWNREGTGGDGRGQLLASSFFDDGKCYQINDGTISASRQARFEKVDADPQGADLWCQVDVRLPNDIHGWYTLYWVWDWPTAPTPSLPDGKIEVYTSCMDVELYEETIESGEVAFVYGQDLNHAGIVEQMLGV